MVILMSQSSNVRYITIHGDAAGLRAGVVYKPQTCRKACGYASWRGTVRIVINNWKRVFHHLNPLWRARFYNRTVLISAAMVLALIFFDVNATIRPPPCTRLAPDFRATP